MKITATKEMKTILMSVGTAFLSAASALVMTGNNYIEAGLLAIVGIGAFYVREVMKEEKPTA